MLRIEKLTKSFGDFVAVDSLDLNINKGDLFGFLGPNGAGKTTTIKMITGLYSPTSGSISINGVNAFENPIESKMKIGYIPDQPFLYDKLTGMEFLYFSGGLYNLSKSYLKNKIEALVEDLKIQEWLYKRTEEYSQGMRQRITIASAFLHDPELIVIDEPMVGLDPQSAFIIKNTLKQKVSEGITVLMSTHSLNVVEEICNRVGIIMKGKLIFDNSIEELHRLKEEKNNNLEQLFIQLTSEYESDHSHS
ncbi:MAG: ABC transporter ATP-binding protein [Melioribacteraceae bacterium]|nr:ABC transporter ATP-binding protein [Melioribacteraceae bacterium]MCF8352857.1 ABC transporter ATP-binding protein [Melioribacteraceae bacterium]MCF8393826.1 ABC transporter ATP-binding protein [Melioribacteraceae bacterium]MCF8417374.1 ABC transporter ATP-binding protein [Melioribacteraceae bacterium]